MKTTPNPASTSSLHPVLWIAGISVTLLSLAGIAALTGILPTRLAPEQPIIAAVAPVTVPAPPTEPVAAAEATATPITTPQTPTVPANKVSSAKRHKKASVNQEMPKTSAMLPPPLDSGVPPDYIPPPTVASAPAAPPPCFNCGIIASVRELTNEGPASGGGAIVGGVLGGALANNIGKGNGRTLATIAGAVGGGLLGNTIEKSEHRTVSYQIAVRMEDGSTRLIDSSSMPPWRIGERVKLVGGAIVSR
ncbi:MAG: glycine zipper 2TM domain-containing protein [Sterolibacterium sp.]|nr:glycine zipper 2TM domain-containing protein [Sterolibacterium sp.]